MIATPTVRKHEERVGIDSDYSSRRYDGMNTYVNSMSRAHAPKENLIELYFEFFYLEKTL